MGPGFAFGPGWESGYDATMEVISGVGALFVILLLLLVLFMLAVSVVFYILQSVSLYAVAKRRGIKKPWLSWLPLGNMWVLGCIADQYQYVAKGKAKNRRNVLLVLTIALYVLCLVNGMCQLGTPISGMVGSGVLTAALMAFSLYSSIALVVVNLVAMVYQYIAMYDLYASCDPDNAVAFLILSIVLPVTYPVLLFIVRKKDISMPPRRTQTVQQTIETPYAAEPEMLPELVEE